MKNQIENKLKGKKLKFISLFNPIRSDTESADLKQTKAKKYQINFEGLFKKKPQKVVDVEKSAGDAPAEDPNDDAAPSEATVIIEDDPPKSVSFIVVMKNIFFLLIIVDVSG